jgi:hypothetical protein
MSVECRPRLRKVRTGHIDIAKVSTSMVLGYPTIAQCMQLIFEFPKCVALEIETCSVLGHSSKDAEESNIGGSHEPTSHFLRHGKRFILHSYHARRIGPGAFGIVSCVVLNINSYVARWRGRRAEDDVGGCGWWACALSRPLPAKRITTKSRHTLAQGCTLRTVALLLTT